MLTREERVLKTSAEWSQITKNLIETLSKRHEYVRKELERLELKRIINPSYYRLAQESFVLSFEIKQEQKLLKGSN